MRLKTDVIGFLRHQIDSAFFEDRTFLMAAAVLHGCIMKRTFLV